jgi:hypothetical protein
MQPDVTHHFMIFIMLPFLAVIIISCSLGFSQTDVFAVRL